MSTAFLSPHRWHVPALVFVFVSFGLFVFFCFLFVLVACPCTVTAASMRLGTIAIEALVAASGDIKFAARDDGFDFDGRPETYWEVSVDRSAATGTQTLK